MAWLEKATLDLTNAQHEDKVCEIVKDFVIENHWNTPFIMPLPSPSSYIAPWR